MQEIYRNRLENYPIHESQRGYFARSLYEEMAQDPKIHLISVDLGFGMLDPIRHDFPNRFTNVGAGELAAVGIATGYALNGYKPFVYTISSFYMRAAEPISLYLAQEQIPVVLLGGGRDNDYKGDGPSHHAGVTQQYMNMMGIDCRYPYSKEEAADLVHEVANLGKPVFVSLSR